MKIPIPCIVLTIIFLSLAVAVICSHAGDEEAIMNKVAAADARILEMLKSEAYTAASLEERKAMVGQMLEELKKERYISHLSYSDESKQFSFKYADKTLGGVSLIDFSTLPGRLPMN